VQTYSNEKRWGANTTRKGKRGEDLSLREYFIIFLKKCNVMDKLFYPKFPGMRTSHQVDKTIFEGDRCRV
jgi:hypothetical protein